MQAHKEAWSTLQKTEYQHSTDLCQYTSTDINQLFDLFYLIIYYLTFILIILRCTNNVWLVETSETEKPVASWEMKALVQRVKLCSNRLLHTAAHLCGWVHFEVINLSENVSVGM